MSGMVNYDDTISSSVTSNELGIVLCKYCSSMIGTLPTLRAVAFNGGAAARIGQRALAQGGLALPVLLLPSSSPAYTIPYATKRDAWLALRDWLT